MVEGELCTWSLCFPCEECKDIDARLGTYFLYALCADLLIVCYVFVLTKGVCNLYIYSIFVVKVMRRAV